MPRQQTEATAYLEIYKLTNERKRLCQELDRLEQQRDRVLHRLAVLEEQVGALAQSAQEFRTEETRISATVAPGSQSSEKAGDLNLNTLFLEY
jgi:phage shock protein A